MYKLALTLSLVSLPLSTFAHVKLELLLKINNNICFKGIRQVDETKPIIFENSSTTCIIKLLSYDKDTVTLDTRITSTIEDKEHLIAKPTLTLTWSEEGQFTCDCRNSPLPIKYYSLTLRASRDNGQESQ
jgi:hypothetical protein